MALKQITPADLAGKGVLPLPDVPGLTGGEMRAKFEEVVRDVVIPAVNGIAENAYSKQEVDAALSAKVTAVGAGDMAMGEYDPLNEDGAHPVKAAGGIAAYVRGSTAGGVKGPLRLLQNGEAEQVYSGAAETVFNVTKGGIGLANVDNTADAAKNVAAAARLTTARTVQTNLSSGAAASFNGTNNIAPGVSGVLGLGNGGTGAGNGINAGYVQSGRFPGALGYGRDAAPANGGDLMFQNIYVPNMAGVMFVGFWT